MNSTIDSLQHMLSDDDSSSSAWSRPRGQDCSSSESDSGCESENGQEQRQGCNTKPRCHFESSRVVLVEAQTRTSLATTTATAAPVSLTPADEVHNGPAGPNPKTEKKKKKEKINRPSKKKREKYKAKMLQNSADAVSTLPKRVVLHPSRDPGSSSKGNHDPPDAAQLSPRRAPKVQKVNFNLNFF